MQSPHIPEAARRVLNGCRTLPIPIEAIAISKGIKLFPYDLGEETSGILVIEDGTATIGYNKNESKVRTRFTIAHELGHFELHNDEDKGRNLFVEKKGVNKVLFRSAHTGDVATQKREMEANQFAACILMPEDLLREEILKIESEHLDEDVLIKVLAKKFCVSGVAMSFRITNLNL